MMRYANLRLLLQVALYDIEIDEARTLSIAMYLMDKLDYREAEATVDIIKIE